MDSALALCTRTSSVSVTDPSRLFSIGTIPRSAIPESTALATAVMLAIGTDSARAAYLGGASSLKEPSGPQEASPTPARLRGGAAFPARPPPPVGPGRLGAG